MRSVYVVGVPGSGKSTAVAGALELLGATHPRPWSKPIPHVRYFTDAGASAGVWELGKRRGSFGGTDALGLGIAPKAAAFVSSIAVDGGGPHVLLAEGDRLAHDSFFEVCPALTIVWIDTPPAMSAARRKFRAEELGIVPQSDAWLKGRFTKVAGIVDRHPVQRIDGAAPPARIARALADLLNPNNLC